MTRKTKRGKIAAKVFAAILSVTLGFSTLSSAVPGSVAFAENGTEVEETVEIAGTEETNDSEALESEAEEEESVAEAATEDVTSEEAVAEDTSNVDEDETAEAEAEVVVEDVKLVETAVDDKVEFTTTSSTEDGIKKTTSKWDFAVAKNTGGTLAVGDSVCGIIVGGGSGRVILDSGKDLNVKNNATAETTGVIYIPIADDTNVVTITVSPLDADPSRYVTLGGFDTTVKLVDDKADTEHQSVTFKDDLKDYVVDKAGDVEGRFIPLFSHGNFKVANIELVETDAVTVVEVSGKLTGEGADKVTGLKFRNMTTEEITTAKVTDGEYSVNLPNGYEYIVSAAGTFDYKVDDTDKGNVLDLSTGNDKTKTKDFALVSQSTVKVSGAIEIVKIDNAREVSAETLKVTLVPSKKTLDSVDLELTKGKDDYNYTYEAVILPEEEYTVKLTNANDYECKQTYYVTKDLDVDLEVTAKPLYKVSLETVTHNLEKVDSVTALTVKNLDDDYEYSFDGLTGDKLDIQVRDGLYEVTEIVTAESYEPYEHFEVDGENVSEKMYLKDTSEKEAIAYAEEVTVGKSDCDYTTIYDALDAVKRMKRDEFQRVTVVLMDEYYQEQVVVDVPNVTFASGLENGSTISWYYGLGGEKYYSAYQDKNLANHLFYDEAHAVDRYESASIGQTPGNWGSTVNLKNTAKGFRAENIIFENSFNFYISDVEKEDIAESGSILDRKAEDADPTLYKSKERACTMYNRGAENIEFYNCSFISSQDTIYTGDKNEYSYFYNCLIEGTTDFICGDGNAIFDNCDLVLYGFSDQSKTDLVILASKGSADKGYLFNYCTVSAYESDKIKATTSAYLGRPWGTSTEKVAFMNTILDSNLIQAKGWTTMNTVPSLNTGLHEYRTRLSDGTKVDLSGRVAANIGSDKQGTAANYVLESEDGYTRADYLSADWTPSYYGADYAEVNEQLLRYNALMADENALAQATDEQKAALDTAYKAVEKGLFAKDQDKVDAFAADLEKAIDVVAGKVTKAPVSNVKAGTYTESFEVELSSETEGAKIYYTTDGSEPTDENGTLYEAAIKVSESVVIKAVAVAEGFVNSEVAVFEYVIEKPADDNGVYVLESKDLTAFAVGDRADGATEQAGTDGYYTLIYSAKSKIDGSSKTWEDEYTSPQRINFGGKVSTDMNAVKFTTAYPATVKVWWVQGGDDHRQMAVLNTAGETVAITEGTYTKNSPYISTLKVGAAGTYFLGGATNNNNIYKVVVTEERPVVSVLESKDLTAFAVGERADGATEQAGTNGYFTLIYSAKSKIDGSSKTWEDEYTSPQRINFGGKVSTEMNAVKFTTGGEATVKVWWVQGGDDHRQMAILNAAGETVAITEGTYTKNSPYISTLKVGAAGTYFLGGATNNNNIYKVEVTEGAGGDTTPRLDWDSVEVPEVTKVALNAEDPGKIDVTASAIVGKDGGDKLTAYMVTGDRANGEREILATLSSMAEKNEFVFTFAPTASGIYYFAVSLSRDGEEFTLESSETEDFAFTLPLAKPAIKTVTNKGLDASGKGRLEITWSKVAEADSYDVEVVQITEDKKEAGAEEAASEENVKVLASATGLTVFETVLEGLPIGEEVTVRVYARRGEEKSEPGTSAVAVTGNNDRTWGFASFGSNGSTKDTAKVAADGSIAINTPSSTKIVPASTDGLGYYYTKMDPAENFTLTAKIKVDAWPYDNGQEGFGLMVADAVGEHGYNEAFWNNSYQALVTQIQYNWDPTIKDLSGNYVGGVTNLTSDSTTVFQEKMRLGIGWIARDGVTLDQKQKAESGQVNTPSGFTTTSGTFETSVASAIQSQLPGITSESGASEVQDAFRTFTIETNGRTDAASYGQLNIIDSSKAAKAVGETVRKVGNVEFTDISELRFQIQRNNTGYALRYLSKDAIGNEADLAVEYAVNANGDRISYVGSYDGKKVVAVEGKVYEVLSQKIVYDENRNNLTQIDKENIYLGMFSARKSAITVEEYTLETADPDSDYPAEEREAELVALNTEIKSAETSNTEEYDLIFNANADGTLSVTNGNKIIAQEIAVQAGKTATVGSKLQKGDNKFALVFTPAPGYTPGEYKKLVISQSDPAAKSVTLEYTVKYNPVSGAVIYVVPGANGSGTKESPASIYEAVNFAAPGQKIYLAAGTYNLGKDNDGSNKNIRIDRGTSGTASAKIVMETDPEDVAKGNRAVLSFAGTTSTGSAFVLSGSYWHLKNFDITGSKNGEKGLLVAGKHNTVEMVNAYKNGNTGIEIARDGNVGRELWPSDNLILNCTSYLNYDAGFEDADGFAAKITCGEGNRFVGCVSAYNADDGWDLFAKVQSGSIGAVTIDGCIAYKNGYLLGSKNGQNYKVFEGADAVEFAAGNGNGFKLGGDGMSGYHVLSNSYAFGNKANGIDSNSCPDIQVFNSVSYANGTNLVLNNYAKSVNSDYTVKGLISIGSGKTGADSISMLGAQVASKIYNDSNFFWDGSKSVNAVNPDMVVTDKIFRSVDSKDLGVDFANGKLVNRDADGSIVFGDFLQLKSSENVTDDEELKKVLEYIEGKNISAKPVSALEGQEIPLYVFAKDVKVLSDIALPENYEWIDGLTETAPYAGTSAAFEVLNVETNDTAMAVVNFVEVKGVELRAVDATEAALFNEGELKLEAVPVLAPAVEAEAISSRFSYSFADQKKMGLTATVADNTVTLARNDKSKTGIASYVATMQYKVGGKNYRVASEAFAFSTRAQAFKFEYTLSGAEADANGKVVVNVGDKFKLEGLKVTGVGKNTNVAVTIGDSKVLKYSKNEFKAVGSGTTYVTLTAAADKTVQDVLMVKVRGKEFAVNSSLLTVDKAKDEGTTFIVSKQGDAELKSVTVGKVLKGTKERTDLKDVFEVRAVVGNVYRITVKDNTDSTKAPAIANGTYSLVLTSGENEFEPVEIRVIETKPYVTVKQTKKVNLFYKAGSTNNTGVLKATSKQAAVTLKIASDSDYNLAADGSTYQLVMTGDAQKKIESKKKLNNRLVLNVSFAGYKKAYDKVVTFNVQTETRAPQYKLEMSNKTLYTALGMIDSEFKVLNLGTGEYLTDAQIALASSRSSYVRSNKYFTLNTENGVYKLTTTKSGTAKISVVDPDFSKDPATKFASTREVILNAPLSISKNKPTVSIASAWLNGEAQYAAESQYTSKVSVYNATDIELKNLTLTGNSKKAKALLPFLGYTFAKDALNQPVVVFSFKNSGDMTLEQAIKDGIIKRGSYTFTANYDVNELTGRRSQVTLNVMGNSYATGTVKGSINLADRTNSFATVTPNIHYLGGTATGMYFKGSESLFDVQWDSENGRAKVYAKEDGKYRAGSTYRVTPVFTVSTAKGVVEITSRPVSIYVKQTKLKLTATPVVEVKLSDITQEGMAVVKATSPKGAEIASMTQLTQTGRFNVSYDTKSGNVYVGIADVKGLKVNSVYSIKMNVVPVGNASNAAQQTYTIKVRVIR